MSLVGSESSDIACSLEPHRVPGRTDEWTTLTARAEGREPIPLGIRLRFPRDLDVAALSRLAVAEQTCCSFFTFNIGVHPHGVTREVTGPPNAQQVITAMFGRVA